MTDEDLWSFDTVESARTRIDRAKARCEVETIGRQGAPDGR